MKASPAVEVCQLYEDSAEGYSKMMNAEIKLPVYTDTLGRLKDRLVDISGPLVDISCGSGHMLSMYNELYDSHRPLLGVDLSPTMVDISKKRLGNHAVVFVADMRKVEKIAENSSAAVLNFFAIHHLDPDDIKITFQEWFRILTKGGQLVVATWEGEGTIDFEGETDIVAFRYTKDKVEDLAQKVGFIVNRCVVEPVADFPMDAIYLEATKP